MSNTNGNSWIALLAGAIIGAGVGILLAPDKGSTTRSKIKGKLKDIEKDISDKYSEFSEDIKTSIKDGKNNFEGNLENVLSDLSYKTEDVISILEKKLADLKQKNAKLQK